jgi:hypothetical protein
MSIDSTITEQIAVRLQEYMANPEHDALNLRQLAARFEALPLCVDWEKCWALRPDGQVVVFMHEGEDPQLRAEEDTRMKNVALFQGSLTYPEIQSLVPDRPADASDCPFCAAKGLDNAHLESQNIICYCGGLGWVPAKT